MMTFLVHKTALAKVLCAAAILAALTVSSQAQIKLGTVDLQKVFEGYFMKQQADTILQERAADADKVIKGWEEEYKKANDEYRKLVEGANDQAVSADEREKRKKSADAKVVEIKDIEKSYLQFKRETGTRIEEEKRRWQERILQDIRQTVSAKAKAANYTLVLDSSNRFNDMPVLLYTNGQNDLTEEVLSELNAKAPPSKRATGDKEEKPPVTPLPKSLEPDSKPGAAPTKPGKGKKP